MDGSLGNAYQGRVKEVLREVFGFEELRAGQAEVVGVLMEGRAALAIFPTGGGKSLCYQLPALMLEGTALVVSPLLALMKDQVDGLVGKGVAAARLDSTLSLEEYSETMRDLRLGKLKLLYVSPEKLANAEFRKMLKGVDISLIAVDEAHCISEWGHSFRPDYLKLAAICRKARVKRILALTATATPKVEADIRRQFKIKKADSVKLSFHRKNLDLRVTACSQEERKVILLEKISESGGPAIVYVTRQETAEEVATFLAKNGLNARAYHAGLRTELRRELQEGFMGGEIEIVVATIAFGMGVDKSDIRAVFHYNLPKSLEGYTQEIGRAGRDGLPARCELLACADDLTVLENFVFSDTPSERAVRNLLERVLRLGDRFDVSIYELATTCDIRQTVIETIFTYLEMEGMIEAGGKFFETYRIKLLRPLKSVLAGTSGSERKVLEGIFAAMDAEWKWLAVNVSEVAPKLGVSGDALRQVISELEVGGDVALKKSGWRQGYRVVASELNLKELSEEMAKTFQERERREIERLEQVLSLATKDRCITKSLLAHFGEKMEGGCGHCDRCRGIAPVKLKRSEAREIKDTELEEIQDLLEEKHPSLGTARQLARFLCGMSSPASMRARLYRNDAYGLLSDLPFGEVEILADSLF
ncbi:MAG: ATP-dependent DNA helicase RecQ [Akkermansiaceae bacterium]